MVCGLLAVDLPVDEIRDVLALDDERQPARP
jgi:hypothetical protein